MRTFGNKEKPGAGGSPGRLRQRNPSLENARMAAERNESSSTGQGQSLTQKAEKRRAKHVQQNQGKNVNDKLARLEKMYQELQDLESKKR